MTATVLEGDCRDVLRTLPERSVQCVVTSPPFFGLRDYGTGAWEGGDPACDHLPDRPPREARPRAGLTGGLAHVSAQDNGSGAFRDVCGKCGAQRVDRQIGLEPTPDEFVAALVEVFREVRRVLRDDGVVWCNLGDSYGPGKQLLGVPWRFAFAMQADGWVLRQDVLWAKLNAMPESVTDRCTRSHEYIFMFAKGRERAGRFAHISDEDARWLALFVDTEGNICVKRGKDVCGGVQVVLAGCHRPLLERVQAIVGAGNILQREGRNAPVYYWQTSNKIARDLLLRLYPHLIVKQRQARIGIYLESLLGRDGQAPSSKREALIDRLWETNKACNSFGDPDLSWVPEPSLFLLTKSPRYFYDADAIREEHSENTHSGNVNGRENPRQTAVQQGGVASKLAAKVLNPVGRNKRSVWTVATQPFSSERLGLGETDHFAVFPPKLIEPCVLAGSSPRACGECGAPWRRVVEREPSPDANGRDRWQEASLYRGSGAWDDALDNAHVGHRGNWATRTVGWESSCEHDDDSGLCVVLDPFNGAGTVGVVCGWHGRDYIGIELNPAYAQMSRERIALEGRPGGRPNGHEPRKALEGQSSFFDILGS
jgi:DNA modification methylase